MVGAAARAQQVVAGAAREERAAPVAVAAGPGAGDLAGEPDRVPVDRGRAVVAPAASRWSPLGVGGGLPACSLYVVKPSSGPAPAPPGTRFHSPMPPMASIDAY